jgi:hypothetical protein
VSFEEKALERFLVGHTCTVRNKTIDSMKADLRTSDFEIEIHGRPIRTICQMEVVREHKNMATVQTRNGVKLVAPPGAGTTVRKPKV